MTDALGPGNELTTEEIQAMLKDLAARRYQNAIGELGKENVRAAMREAGAAQGLQQFRLMIEHRRDEGEWPGPDPGKDYVAFIEALDATNKADDRDETTPTAGVH